MVDKKRAVELREDGLTYEKIAEELGCSTVWCKVNLKGVKQRDIQQEIRDHCAQFVLEGVVDEENVLDAVKHVLGINSHDLYIENSRAFIAFVKFRNTLISEGVSIIGDSLYDEAKYLTNFEIMSSAVAISWGARVKMRQLLKRFENIDPTLDFKIATDFLGYTNDNQN